MLMNLYQTLKGKLLKIGKKNIKIDQFYQIKGVINFKYSLTPLWLSPNLILVSIFTIPAVITNAVQRNVPSLLLLDT